MFKLLFEYLPFVAAALIVLGLVFPRCRQLRLKTRAQAVWAMVILACCSKFACYRMLGGDAFNPDLPWPVMWIWNWAYSGAMIFLVLTLACYFVRARAKLFVLPVLAWGLAAWGIWNGLRVPEVVETELGFADLPAELDGYRILQLSDLHVSSSVRRWRTESVVARANAAQADLIVITGDIADGEPEKLWRDVEPLRDLRAKDGVYCVTGNHERYGPWDRWRACYARLGLRFLENECVFPHAGLALGGFPDGGRFPQGGGREWWRTFAAATNGEFRVLLEHQPSGVVLNVRECDIRLQLSGHTHGGVMPGLSRLVAMYNYGYVRGLYPAPGRADGVRYLYVSPGTGQWAGFPMRFFNDSEITLFVLRRK